MRDYNKNLQEPISYFKNENSFQEIKKKIPQVPIYFLFQLLIFFSLLFLLIIQNLRYKNLEKKIYDQVKINRKLDESTLPLQLKIRDLTRNEILEKLAKEKFLLFPASKEQLIQVEYIE